MQLDHRQSAAILSFPRASARRVASAARRAEDFDGGRAANLAFMLLVLVLAGLWLAFPPAKLSEASPQSSPIEVTGH